MSKRGTILLVEDNEGDVELTLRAVRDHLPDCRLVVANDGVEALEILKDGTAFGDAGAPTLILVDLNMPRMDGKRFLEVIKADERLRTIPVVMLTSSDSRTDIRACYERHANCYILKPFDGRTFMDEVVLVLRFWLDRVRLPETARGG
jgi:CheY-like chemotaxis protein